MKLIKIEIKDKDTIEHRKVKFVTFEKNFVLIQCEKKAFYYATKLVMSIDVEDVEDGS